MRSAAKPSSRASRVSAPAAAGPAAASAATRGPGVGAGGRVEGGVTVLRVGVRRAGERDGTGGLSARPESACARSRSSRRCAARPPLRRRRRPGRPARRRGRRRQVRRVRPPPGRRPAGLRHLHDQGVHDVERVEVGVEDQVRGVADLRHEVDQSRSGRGAPGRGRGVRLPGRRRRTAASVSSRPRPGGARRPRRGSASRSVGSAARPSVASASAVSAGRSTRRRLAPRRERHLAACDGDEGPRRVHGGHEEDAGEHREPGTGPQPVGQQQGRAQHDGCAPGGRPLTVGNGHACGVGIPGASWTLAARRSPERVCPARRQRSRRVAAWSGTCWNSSRGGRW